MDKPRLRFKAFMDEWAFVTMRDVAEKITDGTHDTPKPTKTGIPYLTAIHIKDSGIEYENCYFLPEEEHQKIYKRCNPEKGDMLIVNIGAGTSTCAINTVDYQFSLKNVALVKPNRQRVIPEYLVQIQRRSAPKQFIQLTSGGAQPFLALKEIGKIKVPLCSLDEQQKISSFLSAVDKKISLLVKKHELLIQYKKGAMQKIFNQEIRFKDKAGKDFPEWKTLPLCEVAQIIGGGTPETSVQGNWGGDVQWFTPTELKQKYVSKSVRTITTAGLANSSAKLLPAGTVLFSSRATVGDVAISLNECCTNQGFQSFVMKSGYNNEFLYYWIANNKKLFLEKASGSTFLEISKREIEKLLIQAPCIDEQKRVADFLVSIDLAIELNQHKLDLTKQYKQGLLQQMFI